MNISIRDSNPDDREDLSKLLIAHWGAPEVVTRNKVHYPENLPGFIAETEGRLAGLLTYQITGDSCELVTLNSLFPGHGIGTALVDAVLDTALVQKITRIWLITTNDNLPAIRFYQRFGFTLVAIHRNAIDLSRKLKPQIPILGIDNIPIQDEIEMEIIPR